MKTETRNLTELNIQGTHRNLSAVTIHWKCCIKSPFQKLAGFGWFWGPTKMMRHIRVLFHDPESRCFVDEVSQTGSNPSSYFGSLARHGTHRVGFCWKEIQLRFFHFGEPSNYRITYPQKCLAWIPSRSGCACVPVSCNKHNSSNMGSRFTKSRTLISPASRRFYEYTEAWLHLV